MQKKQLAKLVETLSGLNELTFAHENLVGISYDGHNVKIVSQHGLTRYIDVIYPNGEMRVATAGTEV